MIVRRVITHTPSQPACMRCKKQAMRSGNPIPNGGLSSMGIPSYQERGLLCLKNGASSTRKGNTLITSSLSEEGVYLGVYLTHKRINE